MISDKEIFQSATVLIREHGDDAPIVAAMRADELAEAGDDDGAMTWRRILRAVKELQKGAGPNSPLN